jgi:hypothetical protein
MQMKSLATTVFLLLILSTPVFDCAIAVPPNFQDYFIVQGGFVDIPSGSYVEGSLAYQGIQPNYVVDFENQGELKAVAQEVRTSNFPFWQKIDRLVGHLWSKMPGHEYDNPRYRDLLREYRESGRDIPLSQYYKCGVGVCRERALLGHQLLKAAGIPNEFVYVQSTMQFDGSELTGDHAILVVVHEGQKWVIDGYFDDFHGFRLQDLMSDQGARWRRILAVNAYPRIWIHNRHRDSVPGERIVAPTPCDGVNFAIHAHQSLPRDQSQ